MKRRIFFALLCSSTLLFAVGCGNSQQTEENSSDSTPSVSVGETTTAAPKAESELEQAQRLAIDYLGSIDDTRFPIYSAEYEEGIKFSFTDITEAGCTVSWDSYVVKDFGAEINQNWTINGSRYGSKYCVFEPLYNNGALDSFLIDGVMMTRTSTASDGTASVDIYNFRLIFNLRKEECKLCFTKGTLGLNNDDFTYMGDKMQALYDWVEAGDDMWVEFASDVDKLGSIKDLEKYDGHYYKVFDTPMNWTEARDACEAVGGHLAAINSEEEQDFICDIIKNTEQANIWIGGYYSKGEKKWYWVDDSEWDYTNWADPQPDNYTGDEFYLRMKNRYKKYEYWEAHDGKWNDTADSADGSASGADAPISSFGYVCEWDSIRDLY